MYAQAQEEALSTRQATAAAANPTSDSDSEGGHDYDYDYDHTCNMGNIGHDSNKSPASLPSPSSSSSAKSTGGRGTASASDATDAEQIGMDRALAAIPTVLQLVGLKPLGRAQQKCVENYSRVRLCFVCVLSVIFL